MKGLDFDMDEAKTIAFVQQKKRSQCNISKHRVSACLVAKNENGTVKYFGGCNIELATSRVWHAEEVALTKAISEGHRDFIAIIVTSKDKQQRAALCGYCRQDYMYANSNIPVFVLEPNGKIKLYVKHLVGTLKFPYMGSGKLDK